MPVTLQLNSHPARPVDSSHLREAQTTTDVLLRAAPGTSGTLRELLHSSLPTSVLPNLIPASNGLIHASLRAYNDHQHLHIRPDDVWITILTQFSIYVNAHAEELREWFVQHEGKKALEVKIAGRAHGADYGWMAQEFCKLMEAELVPGHGLKDWILPEFTTTTKTDTAVEAGLMMCTLKSYFEFRVCCMCGIPSVTLLGTKEDWVLLRKRIDKFLEFGEKHKDLKEWHGLLGPVLDKFVETFSTATSEEQEKEGIRDFWNLICKEQTVGSGGTRITGWLCYLCPFSDKGIWQLSGAPIAPIAPITSWDFDEFRAFSDMVFGEGNLCRWRSGVDTDEIAAATADVPVKINDNGVEIDAVMVTGLAGYEVFGKKRDTLRPLPAWWMFEVDDEKRKERDRIIRERLEWERSLSMEAGKL